MHFHDTYTSLPINRAEYHKRVRMKLEEGVHLSLESIRIVEDEEEHARLEYEEEARLIEESRLEADEEEQAWMRADNISLQTM